MTRTNLGKIDILPSCVLPVPRILQSLKEAACLSPIHPFQRNWTTMNTQITTIDLLRTSIEPSLRSIPRSHQSKGSRNENGFGYPPTQALGSNAAITNYVAGKSSEILPVLTSKQKILARVQFAALCWTLFVAGWNDGTTGPLLSRIQEVYGV